ncbi:hypothetical protein ACRAWD_12550 [Caulobacter segnis]
MTKHLSPLRMVSFVMAVWYMALAMANLFTGSWIAAIAPRPRPSAARS